MMAGSSCHVDDDLVMDILSRVPVKSLMRFRCVCKSWYSLIKSPYFISKHLQYNRSTLINGKAPLFVTSQEESIIKNSFRLSIRKFVKPILSWMWISSNNETVYEGEAGVPLFPFINTESLPFFEGAQTDKELLTCFSGKLISGIIGPVDGIYCVICESRIYGTTCRNETVFLWNPSLREVKSIPDFLLRHSCQAEEFFRTYGFGYDSKINDFIVVAIARFWYNSGPKECIFLYTLSTNSWRIIDTNLPALPSNDQYAVFVSHGNNGVFHWLARGRGRGDNVILSFELGSEVFRTSQRPHDMKMLCVKGTGDCLFISNVSLFYISSYIMKFEHATTFYYEVWVMKENGTDKSWTKVFTIGPSLVIVMPLGVGQNSEIFFEKRGKNNEVTELVSYDPHCQEIKNLHIRSHKLRVHAYMESMVSINGG